ncbi:hypothetical protein PU630_08260 [Microbacterium horticulturae]|uniref:PH domain-containing protein n=1 Tax=Microbacterium horticulturae TaxID=3028316 RepID=A0ABY8C479_9MICO|nr:hypothetical protein [Microbacterium sp. KACC 23027]WEG10517.1 hypothetical protein PU630_08260 [Microbacterium sp. KACC 23027]
MTREGALLIMIAIAVVLLGLMAWGWYRRTKRDAEPLTAVRDLPAGTSVIAGYDGLYVATTRHGEPLERIAAPGLGFRSRADITIATAGIALDIPGQQRLVIPAERITAVALATVAIDRVVEKDGLVCVSWRTDPGTTVDTYLRARDASSAALVDSIRPLIHDSRTGSAA